MKDYRVRDMMDGLAWGAGYGGDMPAHILKPIKGQRHQFHRQRAECGASVLGWARSSLLDVKVCKRCLKATEKYA